jgi:hypothetical protein
LPRVVIATGIAGPDGREEKLSEHLCDHPDCANIAVEVVGVVRELAQGFALCAEHAASYGLGRRNNIQSPRA